MIMTEQDYPTNIHISSAVLLNLFMSTKDVTSLPLEIGMSVTDTAFIQPSETSSDQAGRSTPIMNDIAVSNSQTVNYDTNFTTPSDAASALDNVLAHIEHDETNQTKQTPQLQLDHKPFTSKPKGNLESYESMFESWRKQELQMEQNTKVLSQKLVLNTEKCKEIDRRLDDREKSIALLQAAIKSLHNDLNLVDTLSNENSELKSKIATMTKENNNINIKSEQNEIEYDKKLLELQQIHETDVSGLKAEMGENLIKQRGEIEEITKKKDNEILELKTEIEMLKKEKESEVAMVTVDYENKLAKLQRQNAVASMNQQQTSSSQEIYRRKLQHMKMEYDSETMALKEQLRSAQAQLSTYQQRERQHVSVPQASKKMRKY